nr:S41 family peptidase [uncultured Mucilaginibacter sp.]
MKRFSPLWLIFGLLSCRPAISQTQFNGDLETLSADRSKPAGWITYFQPEQLKSYPVKVDSIIKQQGKYAVSIEKAGEGGDFGVIDYVIPKTFKGSKVELRGYVKTENVTAGYAGLWMRVDGSQAFDNMQGRGITGTTDWKEYVVELPYDETKAINIHLGALLVGKGKMWVDNFRLFIDGQPIQQVKAIERTLAKAERDTAFNKGSKIETVTLSKQQISNLAMLGQVWGFVKYHHPNVAKGDVNMDAELFRVMPAVLKAGNNEELSAALANWLKSLGAVPKCTACVPYKGNNVKLEPDYGQLFSGKVLSKTLTDELSNMLNNEAIAKNYYVTLVPGVGNPVFTNEMAYSAMKYPDAGFRLLCLYRYWSMIQYYFPYKYLITENWNEVLADCIPKFVRSANATEYTLNTLALISRVHDTHANIGRSNQVLNDYKGKNAVPFKAKFVEEQLVVTGYYNDTLNVKELVKPGDIITAINGKPVTELIKKYLPYTPASNYAAQLRDLPLAFLLRNNEDKLTLNLQRDGKQLAAVINTLPMAKINYAMDYDPSPKAKGFYLMDNNIGYLYPGKYHNKDLDTIKALFEQTKGIIIDMRCYPSEFMPYTFGPYIKTNNTPFVKFSAGSISRPGLFVIGEPIAIPPALSGVYKGKVVVIVNETSQSQAEYTTMCFQSSPNVTVIGSTTAGADGNVSSIALPGGISTMISGIGVYYPDGTETQRKGVRIDVPIKPTIAGIKAGKDELLEKAKDILLK